MKRSQLREVIKSILRRKLSENSGNGYGKDAQLATFTKNHAEWDSFDKVQILSHHGSEPLEITEFWIDKSNNALRIGVVADVPPPQMEEAVSVSTSDSPQDSNVSINTNDAQNDSTSNDADVYSPAEKLIIAKAQQKVDEYTNKINEIEGDIKRAEEPLQKKMIYWRKKQSDYEKKRGAELKRIENIKRKHSKVEESVVSESGLVQNSKHKFNIEFKTHFVSPGIDKEYHHKFETFPANSKEELPQAIQNWLDGHVHTAEKNGKEGITWKLLPNTLQYFPKIRHNHL